MKQAGEYCDRLAARAAFLNERILGVYIPDEKNVSDTSSRLADKWRQTVAGGDEAVFGRRLALDGFTSSAAAKLVGEVRLADGCSPPAWLIGFQRLITRMESYGAKDRQAPPYCSGLAEALWPLITAARSELDDAAGKDIEIATDNTLRSFEAYLAGWLTRLCANALEHEYKLFCLSTQPGLSILNDLLAGGSIAENNARRFANSLRADGLAGFFGGYPVLARLVTTCIQDWVESLSEFFRRLQSDMPAIAKVFGYNDVELQNVTAGSMGLSDRHNHGRTVIDLTFNGGLRLIYKPRQLSLDVAYYRLLLWLNDQTGVLDSKILRVIEREGYGWVEYVAHCPCSDEEAVGRYYMRAGGLLAVFYLLGGGDAHFENVIACGEYPVLIDLETALQADVKFFQDSRYQVRAFLKANDLLAQSVLHTGLLPNWVLSPDKAAYDVSGIAGPRRHDDSTAGACAKSGFGSFGSSHNLPLLAGQPVLPFSFADEVAVGFAAVYRCLQEAARELYIPGGLLTAFTGQPFRFIFRATRVYDQLIGSLTRPELLTDGAAWSIGADVLARIILKPQVQDYFLWPLIQAEIEAIARLDIPYFTGCSDSGDLQLGSGKTIQDFFAVTAQSRVKAGSERLCVSDEDWQTELIRASMRTSRQPIRESEGWKDAARDLSRSAAKDEAERLARILAASAILAGEEAAWIGYEYLPPTTAMQLQPLDCGLYNGVSGIALFLAALSAGGNGQPFRGLAQAAANSVVLTIQDKLLSQRLTTAGIGAANGMGSLVYGLTAVARFLGEPHYLRAAARAAEFMEPLIRQDRHFDVVGGAAGAILGLVKLYSVTGEENSIRLARMCADHLLAHRTVDGWPTIGGRIAAGFAHGQAGIAYALTRLYEFDRREELLSAALSAIKSENTLYSPDRQNWQDIRLGADAPDEDKYPGKWCHGAPGIGLARLGNIKFLPDAYEDVERAIAATAALPQAASDHLCCGNFGCADVLLTAGHKLKRPDLTKAGSDIIAAAVARAVLSGRYALPQGLEKFCPGLWTGVAGIGYELLRLTDPEKYPSVLLFE